LNAHSWVEVYFSGIGWVEFEPTSSIPEIARTDEETTVPSPQTDSTAARTLNRFRLEQTAYFLLPIFILLSMALIYFILIEKWWYLQMQPAHAIEQIYRKFYRAGRPFVGAQLHSETALEFAQKLTLKLNELEELSIFKNMLTSIKSNTAKLTDLYNSSLFIDVKIQKVYTRTAWHAWTQLRWRLFFTKVILYQANRVTKTNHAQLEKN